MEYDKIYQNVFKNNKNYNSDHSISYQKGMFFLQSIMAETKINSITDIGSGKGNLIRKITELYSNKIFSYDLECFYDAKAFNDVEFKKLNLATSEIENIEKVDFLFCLDVLEHLEEKHIDNILFNFSKKAKHLFLTIANHSDIIDGIELHLIQKPNYFWNEKINKYFKILNYESAYDDRLMCYSLETNKD
jgi:2-polyprenyl-3-methyl-5-hydroxy-6-metoxy-1,4-benzoquinol methylase